MADGGAITGRHGAAVLRAILGLPHNREWTEIKGRVPRISDNPGSWNLPILAAIGDYAVASSTIQKHDATVNLLLGLENEKATCQGQEAGGYHETWWYLRGALLTVAWDDPDLRNEVFSFVRRGALIASLCNLEGTICMVGGRAQRCGQNPVQEVCCAMLIGMPVKQTEKWWRNPGNIGALLLAIWLSEHGRNDILSPEDRASLRSWVMHGTVPEPILRELRLYDAVEVRRWPDRLVAWAPNGVRSFERDGHSPNHPIVISDLGHNEPRVQCSIVGGGPPVSEVPGGLMAAGVTRLLMDKNHKTSLGWDGERWLDSGSFGEIETPEAPLPTVSRDWLPTGEEPMPESEKGPNRDAAVRQLTAASARIVAAQTRIAQGDYSGALLAVDFAGESLPQGQPLPGALQHLTRALAALRGEI